MTTNWADGQRMFLVLTGIFTLFIFFFTPWKERGGKNSLTRAEQTLSNKLWFVPACLCFCFPNAQLHISQHCKHLLFEYISCTFNTSFFSTSWLDRKQVHWANLTQYLKLKLGSSGGIGGARHVAALLFPDWGKTAAYPVQIFAHANLEFIFDKHSHV